jgi:hypothetical protein
MALLGMHRDIICKDCGFAFSCDAAVHPASPRALCPNCGYSNDNLDSLPILDGDRVLIDRSAFFFRGPQRWDIVAFRHPREANKIVIKRVVGLPGEKIQIKNGEIYVNGQIQSKNLDRQRSMAVMVYDANFSPALNHDTTISRPRWQGENETSHWISDHGRFAHPVVEQLSISSNTSENSAKIPHPSPLPEGEGTIYSDLLPEGEGTIYSDLLPEGEGTIYSDLLPKGEGTIYSDLLPREKGAAPEHSSDGKKDIDWLVYHHWRRIPYRQDEVQECPITDIMAYNQSLPRREEDVHAMSDLMFSFRITKTFGQGKFFVRAYYGTDIFQLEIDPKAGVYRINRNDRVIMPECKGSSLENKPLEVVVSLIDRQFLLALNDRTVFCLPLDDPVQLTEPLSQPFAIGTDGLGVEVENLRIFRDIYYTNPVGRSSGWLFNNAAHLSSDEYVVLGDNSSIAEDSRTWPPSSPITDNLLIGKPLMILFPIKLFTIANWQFQVPVPRRIGYIR